jgi:dihydrofolate reductase
MARLIYSAISSLDGYIEDANGKFDWAVPDEEVHRYINDLVRSTSTYLYGRRMYETMMGWETDPALAAQSPLMQDFAEVWGAADKIVYSKTLEVVATRKTRIEQDFNPKMIRKLKAVARHDILIGGPNLAAYAFRARLIDECHLFLAPVIVGGGKQSLPNNIRLELLLLEEHRFSNGMVHLRYQAQQQRGAI